ncbi:uncharacterized protein M437DRAFT_46221, partial [Aureobasidium melanogenum CBS 110374]
PLVLALYIFLPRQSSTGSQHLPMASTKQLEDTLPRCDSYHNRAGDTLSGQWPIYSLVAFDEPSLKQVETDINEAEDSTSNSILMTEPDLSNSTLRDVYDHHIRLRDENDKIHHTLSIAVDQSDYQANGVLVVDLKVMTDTSQTVIGVLRCGYDDADLYCANLDIGNMSFIDYKKEEQRLWGGDDPYENQRYFSRDAASPAPPSDEQHYAWYSNVEMGGPIQDLLEPGWIDMIEGESRLHRVGGWFNFPDPWHEIRRQFPYHCLQQPELHRKLFLVAEKAGNEPDALSICKAEWNGDLGNYHYDPNSHEGRTRDREKMFAIMPDISVVKKVRPGEALDELDRLVCSAHTGNECPISPHSSRLEEFLYSQ